VAILALGTSLTFALLGGYAVVTGKIPLVMSPGGVVRFSAGGGIAIFIIVLMLGHFLYAKPGANDAEIEMKETGTGFPRRDAQNRAEKCATAERAAGLEARARLLEEIAVQIRTEANNQNQRVENSAVTSYARGKLTGSQVLNKKEIDNCDSVEITVGIRVNLKEAVKEISTSP